MRVQDRTIFKQYIYRKWVQRRLSDIFIKLAYIPKVWRKSHVVFVFLPKPGKEIFDSPESFRAINLMLSPLKTLEKRNVRHIRDQHAYMVGKLVETVFTKLWASKLSFQTFVLMQMLNRTIWQCKRAVARNRGLSPKITKWIYISIVRLALR